jgi:hypothetical protein
MLPLMPDWMYGFVDPAWWPDRPREFWVVQVNVLPLAANASPFILAAGNPSPSSRREIVFSKRADTLVFGGQALVTTEDNLTIFEPLSGTVSQTLVRMSDPSASIVYSDSFTGSVRDVGFVPLENLFSCYKAKPARRPAVWPMPVHVKKGASLRFEFINTNAAAAHNMRLTFWCGLIEAAQLIAERQVEVATT